MRKLLLAGLFVGIVASGLSGCSKNEESDKELVIYSARNDHLVKPLLDQYTTKTGITFQLITDNEAALLERLKVEADNTPADVLITVDAGNLWHASNEGVLAQLESPILNNNIPARLRSSKNDWFGMSVRARTIVYAPDRVEPSELSSYENLADPVWEERLCLRTSKKVYNQSLVATLIATLGMDETEKVVKGWVNNLATSPYANDIKMMLAIAAGQCDVGIGNTYYFGRLQKDNPDLNLALFWPNQKDRGVHVNISGAGVTKHSKNSKAAQTFLEWLSDTEAQKMFAGLNLEYPANSSVAYDPLVKSWGKFKQDIINVEDAGALQGEAIKLMDRVGYR